MDYFVEIAENPDIQEALGRLYNEPNYPEDLQQTRPSEDGPLLSDTHPSIWRAEIVNWFHLHPGFAAAVWRELAFCISERKRLARAAWTASWLQRHRLQSIMKQIGLEATADEIEKERKFADATPANIEDLRKELGLEYLGPEFIERLIMLDSRPRSTETIAALITNVTEVKELAEKYGVPVPFAMVHEREMEQIAEYRKGRSHANSGEAEAATDANGGKMPSFDGAPIRRALANNLVGLAFSGGGIRSATFNLGVLQSLANLDVLRHCDYLSTVSGGGYIGSWFSAWTLREAQQIATTALTPNKRAQDRMRLLLSPLRSPYPLDTCIRPIRYLREFSNYLTPQTGFFSADTWTMMAIYFRNLLLNLLVLIPLITTVLLTPHFLFGVTQWLFEPENGKGLVLIPLLISISFCVPLYVLIRNLRRTTPPPNTHQMIDEPGKRGVDREIRMPRFARQGWIQFGVVLPLLIAAWLTSYWISVKYEVIPPAWLSDGWTLLKDTVTLKWLTQYLIEQNFLTSPINAMTDVALTVGVISFVYLGIIYWGGGTYRYWLAFGDRHWLKKYGQAIGVFIICTLGAAIAATGLFRLLGDLFATFVTYEAGYWPALAFATPLTFAAYSIVLVIHLGLLGVKYPDEQREWWSRLRAWTLIYSLGWAALFTIAIWIPYGAVTLQNSKSGWEGQVKWGAIIAWVLSTFAGVKTGSSATETGPGAAASKPDGPNIKSAPLTSSRVKSIVALLAPYIFILGLFVLISCAIDKLLPGWLGLRSVDPYWKKISVYDEWWVFGFAITLVVLSIFISWRIGVNEFSLHNFYKNRLVRCYLGASRWRLRKADWFTGFDMQDDTLLSAFDHAPPPNAPTWPRYPGPYPIINAALNLAGGKDLAWQERKATSFIFTPKYCGFDIDRAVLQKDKYSYWPDAYAPTREYVADGLGPSLGTAMAISGAAANPNMGKATSAASAFLMTVFNVRLGWWLPNPRRKGKYFGWDRSGPTLGINYTAVELFGMTDDEKKFVNVSDGGHFENLGAYELIRRGCRYVIASDAGQDGAFNLEDLGNLIRKCRTDFGVEIEIGTNSIRDRNLKGWSSTHCVVGKIHYLTVPKHDCNGQLIYNAGQPAHEEGLLLYLKPSITGDEPFDILEYYCSVPEFPHESTSDQWFNESQFESYRRLGMHVAETTFMRYRERPDEAINVDDLFQKLKGFWHAPSPKVADNSTAHAQEYIRIMELLRSKEEFRFLDPVLFKKIVAPGLAGQRDEFYVCNALIQLVENVYADLDLEQNYDHPHVEGWMSIFKQWAREEPFKRTWAISKSTYATRFRNFFDDRLAE